jgi:hypothetical protein
VIADNATGKGSATVKGAVRRGELLLAGRIIRSTVIFATPMISAAASNVISPRSAYSMLEPAVALPTGSPSQTKRARLFAGRVHFDRRLGQPMFGYGDLAGLPFDQFGRAFLAFLNLCSRLLVQPCEDLLIKPPFAGPKMGEPHDIEYPSGFASHRDAFCPRFTEQCERSRNAGA